MTDVSIVNMLAEVARLKQQLAECQKACEEEARLNGAGGSREAALMARLAESQAREKVRIEALRTVDLLLENENIGCTALEDALAMPSDSTALDAARMAAKRETLLDAADWSDNCGEWLANSTFSGLAKQFRSMAESD